MSLFSSRGFFWAGAVLTASGAVLFAVPAAASGAGPHRSMAEPGPASAGERPGAVGLREPQGEREPRVPLDTHTASTARRDTADPRLHADDIVFSQVIGEAPWHREVALAVLGVGVLALGAHWVASRRTGAAHQRS